MPRATVKRAVSRTTRATKLRKAATAHRDAKLGKKILTMGFKPQSQVEAKARRRETVNRGGASKSRRSQRGFAGILGADVGKWVKPKRGVWSKVKNAGK